MWRQIRNAFYKKCYSPERRLRVLHHKINKGDLQAVQDIFALGVVTEITRCGDTMLQAAVLSKRVEVVRFLIGQGVNVQALNQWEQTVLIQAICGFLYDVNSLAIVKLLLEKNVSVNSGDNLHKTALHHLLEQRAWKEVDKHAMLLETLALLLQAGATVHAQAGQAASCFINEDNVVAAPLLIQYGADCHMMNKNNTSVFHKAMMFGDKSLVLQLLQQQDLLLTLKLIKIGRGLFGHEKIRVFFEREPELQARLRERGMIDKGVSFVPQDQDVVTYQDQLLNYCMTGLRKLLQKAFEGKQVLYNAIVVDFLVYEETHNMATQYLLFFQNKKVKSREVYLVFQNFLGALKAAVEPKMAFAYQGLEQALKALGYEKMLELLLKQYAKTLHPEDAASAVLQAYLQSEMRTQEPSPMALCLNHGVFPEAERDYPISPLLTLQYLVKGYPLMAHHDIFDAFRNDAAFCFLPQKVENLSKIVDAISPVSEAIACLYLYLDIELQHLCVLNPSETTNLQIERLRERKAALPEVDADFSVFLLLHLRYLARLYPGVGQYPMFEAFRGYELFEFLFSDTITESCVKTAKKSVRFSIPPDAPGVKYQSVSMIAVEQFENHDYPVI